MFKAVPTEYLERYYPLRVDSYRARMDSGGAGYHRGGHGIAKTYTFLEDGQITFQDDRAHTYPWGVDGGQHGAPSEKQLIRAGSETPQELPSKVENLPVRKGDVLVFSTAGAGGLGDPLERELERTATDVRAGLVSVEAAAKEYGVVVSASGEVDEKATETTQEKLRKSRGAKKEFEFGPVPGVGELRSQIAAERRDFDSAIAGEADAGS